MRKYSKNTINKLLLYSKLFPATLYFQNALAGILAFGPQVQFSASSLPPQHMQNTPHKPRSPASQKRFTLPGFHQGIKWFADEWKTPSTWLFTLAFTYFGVTMQFLVFLPVILLYYFLPSPQYLVRTFSIYDKKIHKRKETEPGLSLFKSTVQLVMSCFILSELLWPINREV